MSTVRKTIIATLTTGAFVVGGACANAGDFSAIDTDGSGGLSLQELHVVIPDLGEGEFAAHDSDGSGELSELEYASLKAAKMDDDASDDDATDG